MNGLDDGDLTTHGLPATGSKGRILVIACGALAREILAVIDGNGWAHIDLTCLPASCIITRKKFAAQWPQRRPNIGPTTSQYLSPTQIAAQVGNCSICARNWGSRW